MVAILKINQIYHVYDFLKILFFIKHIGSRLICLMYQSVSMSIYVHEKRKKKKIFDRAQIVVYFITIPTRRQAIR